MTSYASLRPVCGASQRKYTEYAGGVAKSDDHRIPCPECGKVVKLHKRGLDRFPSTIPRHHVIGDTK